MGGFFEYPGQMRSAALGADSHTAFWAGASAADWQTLLGATQTLRFVAGDIALAAGVSNSTVSIVVSGGFTSGQCRWAEGEVFGIDSFFSLFAVAEAVVATTDSEVVRLSRSAIETLGAREPELVRDVLYELGRILAVTPT